MSSAQAILPPLVPLATVLCTHELFRRPVRPPNDPAVIEALLALAQTMAVSPERVLQQLVEKALSLCSAHSAGLSLLEEENGERIFRWHGVAGKYAPHLWGTTPRDFSPCGTVLDTNAVQLMSRLDRHFTYFAAVEPRILEALLVPFHVGGKAIGTIWVISHEESRRFDGEDARVMATLGEFAAAAYQTLSGLIALKGIIATIREPLLVLDGSLRVITASQSYYETFHVTPNITEGQLLSALGDGQWDIPELSARLRDVVPSGSIIEQFEMRRDFPLLGRRVMTLNARKISREGNPKDLILLTFEDVTRRKQNEEELLRSYEDSQHFALMAAHDLRAPLNSAVALLQLINRRMEAKLDDEERHLWSTATGGLQRLRTLIDDLLDYALVRGTEKAATVIALREPLQLALANLQADLAAANAEVQVAEISGTVNANHSLLVLIFQNLIGNAIKFRADAPLRIQIGAAQVDQQIVVSVADNGQGFAPKYAEQIFLPFKRLHGPDTPGSGIGLTTCKRIVERLGGRIWAEGTVGKGATFHFALPSE